MFTLKFAASTCIQHNDENPLLHYNVSHRVTTCTLEKGYGLDRQQLYKPDGF